MPKHRKHYTPQQKISVLREHLIEKESVSDICEKHGLKPTVFYRWQKDFFDNGALVFERSRGRESAGAKGQIEALRKKLARKDMVIAEIMEDYVAVKKTIGDDL